MGGTAVQRGPVLEVRGSLPVGMEKPRTKEQVRATFPIRQSLCDTAQKTRSPCAFGLRRSQAYNKHGRLALASFRIDIEIESEGL